MHREKLLSTLSIRLSHLADTGSPELVKELEQLRLTLRNGMNETEIQRISEKLARHMLLTESEKPESSKTTVPFATELAQDIRALAKNSPGKSMLIKLADDLQTADSLDEQLKAVRAVLTLLEKTAGAAAPKRAGASGFLGLFDRKGGVDDQQIGMFLEKSARLIEQAIKHVDVLNGNSKDTRKLKQALKDPDSVDSMGAALEEVISLLQEHGQRIEEERATTQTFLGELRSRLSSVEESIFSVISDGTESLGRAEVLERQVGDDVLAIGEAVQQDDLSLLRMAVEHGLTKLSTKVTDYLTLEKVKHKESKKKIEGLNRTVHEMEAHARDLRGQIKTKQDLAIKDILTGVYNRAGYEQRILEELSRSKRSHSPLSLVFIDCNKFKQINDTFGHAAGDLVLVEIANALTARARASDLIARYGGDEFVALLPDTPADGAAHFAKDSSQRIREAGFNANGSPLDVSISCGITEIRADDTPEIAIKRADEAMYLAKKSAIPQVVVV